MRPILAKNALFEAVARKNARHQISIAYFFKDIIILYNLYEFPENGDITSMWKLKKTVENCRFPIQSHYKLSFGVLYFGGL